MQLSDSSSRIKGTTCRQFMNPCPAVSARCRVARWRCVCLKRLALTTTPDKGVRVRGHDTAPTSTMRAHRTADARAETLARPWPAWLIYGRPCY
jgi:hypothetical protein